MHALLEMSTGRRCSTVTLMRWLTDSWKFTVYFFFSSKGGGLLIKKQTKKTPPFCLHGKDWKVCLFHWKLLKLCSVGKVHNVTTTEINDKRFVRKAQGFLKVISSGVQSYPLSFKFTKLLLQAARPPCSLVVWVGGSPASVFLKRPLDPARGSGQYHGGSYKTLRNAAKVQT